MPAPRQRIGLIVNPIAGMGGRVGLKGTDGVDVLGRARELRAEPVAPARALRALRRLEPAAAAIELITPRGVMGGDVARQASIEATLLDGPSEDATSAADTREAARALRARGVGLVVFAGGDGTACDIVDMLGDAVPMLGIPSGVKMHSAVFATSPEAAGQLAAMVASDRQGKVRTREAEVMDIDEDGVREGRLSARLHGYGRVPYERHLVQNAKAGGIAEDAALDAVCREIAEEMQPGVVYVVGPGSTTQRILAALGLDGSLLGVDAVLDGRLVGRDLTDREVAKAVRGRPARIVVTVIGGQGFVFGRGNQQIGPGVIRAVGRDNIVIVATQEKLLSLDGGRLLVDTGDRALDEELEGYVRVRTGPNRSVMMRIAA
ncbi:MAG: ATP-NAD kinase family protein [Alphaproteobacteria bacterium]|nr:ATP-NAD kinase family protein [Alphaproteobacteria bacterium]